MILWLMTTALAAKVQCDAAAIDKGVAALQQVEGRYHVELAAAAIGEACKLPPTVAEGLAKISQVGPDYRPMMDLQLATLAPERVEASCKGGLKALGEMAALAPAAKRAHLWTRCGSALSPFVAEAEWSGAGGLVAAPLIFGPWLVELGVKPDAARAFARALAGISDRPKDNPVRQFQPLVP